jgi:hypothetical protein
MFLLNPLAALDLFCREQGCCVILRAARSLAWCCNMAGLFGVVHEAVEADSLPIQAMCGN